MHYVKMTPDHSLCIAPQENETKLRSSAAKQHQQQRSFFWWCRHLCCGKVAPVFFGDAAAVVVIPSLRMRLMVIMMMIIIHPHFPCFIQVNYQKRILTNLYMYMPNFGWYDGSYLYNILSCSSLFVSLFQFHFSCYIPLGFAVQSVFKSSNHTHTFMHNKVRMNLYLEAKTKSDEHMFLYCSSLCVLWMDVQFVI